MQKYRLSIATTVDGESSGFVSNGQMQTFSTGVRLEYTQENAKVSLELKREEVVVVRDGDYMLSLCLKGKEKTKGRIGINGAEGEIVIYTHEITYEKKGDLVKICLAYDLYFGEVPQKMQLSILAKPIV